MTRFALVGVLALSAFGLPNLASAQEGKRYAMLVGVNEYEHSKLVNLKWAENDAAALAKVLEKAGYTVSLLTNSAKSARLKPTKANVDARLKEILRDAGKNDTVLIAFAGHGLQFENQKDAYFCPSDARPFKDEANTLVSLGKVYDELDKSFAATQVLFVDACRDDPAAGRGSRGVDADSAPPPPKGVAALFSCSAGQRAFESDDLKHGVFFHHILEGLSGKAKDADGEVTFSGLSEYVAKKVKADVPKLIGGGAKQLPHQKGEFIGGSPVLLKPSLTIAGGTVIVVETNHGRFKVELFEDKAPVTVKNFLRYVEDKHYDGTIFHRVIENFMIQGGGYEPGMKEKKTRDPIKNEAANGLSNLKGTIAMARTSEPDTATAQWFVNVADNTFLDKTKDRDGYCVFGRVVEGMDVIEKIKAVETDTIKGHESVPTKDVIIKSVKVAK